MYDTDLALTSGRAASTPPPPRKERAGARIRLTGLLVAALTAMACVGVAHMANGDAEPPFKAWTSCDPESQTTLKLRASGHVAINWDEMDLRTDYRMVSHLYRMDGTRIDPSPIGVYTASGGGSYRFLFRGGVNRVKNAEAVYMRSQVGLVHCGEVVRWGEPSDYLNLYTGEVTETLPSTAVPSTTVMQWWSADGRVLTVLGRASQTVKVTPMPSGGAHTSVAVHVKWSGNALNGVKQPFSAGVKRVATRASDCGSGGCYTGWGPGSLIGQSAISEASYEARSSLPFGPERQDISRTRHYIWSGTELELEVVAAAAAFWTITFTRP